MGVDKNRNTEHSGTCRNFPEHPGTWKNKGNFHEKKIINNNNNNNNNNDDNNNNKIIFVKINLHKIT